MICWEKGAGSSRATWAANWRASSTPDQVSGPPWFSSAYKGAIEICRQWKLWCFPLFYGHLLFSPSNADPDGSPTYRMPNGHRYPMDFSQWWADSGLVSRFSRLYSVNITRLVFMLLLCRRWDKQVLHCDLYSDETTNIKHQMLGLWGFKEKKHRPTYQSWHLESPANLVVIWLRLLSALAHRQKKNCMQFADFSVLDAWNHTLTQI